MLIAATEETILDDATRSLEAAIDDSKEQSLEVLKAALGRKGEGEEPEIEVWQGGSSVAGGQPTHDTSGAPQLPWIHRTLLDTLGEY